MTQVETQKHLNVSTSIKTVEDLSKSILNDPDKIQSFHKFIEEKYELQSKDEILNVSHDELSKLRNDIQASESNFDNLWAFVYDDYMETQLETRGLEWVSLNVVTKGIENPRLNEIKQEFEAYFDNVFKKYDFISPSQKELFKISIVNKLLDSQMSSVWTDMMWNFSNKVTWATKHLQEWEYSEAISSVTDTSEFSEWSDIMKSSLDACMKTYTDKLDTIKQLIQSTYPTLSIAQLQNIFSNISEFKDPSFIENNIESFDITTIDFSKSEEFNTEINTENIKEYILNSRENISDVADKLSQWDKMQEVVLDLISDKNFWWAMKGFLGILMKLPIIGDMISTFLWLDKKNPMGSLEKLSWKYNFFNWLLNQWQVESKNWKGEWKWVFKDINFWEQNFQENKSVIEKIMSELPNLDEKSLAKFWQDSFSKDGVKIKWVSLRFQGLENSDNFENWVMKQWILNDLLKQGFSNYENDLWELDLIEQQKEQEKKEQEKNKKIMWLEDDKKQLTTSIVNANSNILWLSSILNESDLSNIEDWDDWFNIWDITDITLSDIKKSNTPEDAVKLIETQIWDDISEINKPQILELCNQIILYLSQNNIHKDIETIGDLFDESLDVSKDFFEYIKSNITLQKSELEQLQQEEDSIAKELDVLWVQPTREEKLAKSLLFIQEWTLSEWIQFWEYTLQYNPDNWELLLWDIKYKIFYNNSVDNIFSDMFVDKWMVTFNVWWIEKKAPKLAVLMFLHDSILSTETESIFKSKDSEITLQKQV